LTSTQYIRIGQLLKPVGTNGEIKIDIDDNFFDDFVNSNHFIIKINGNYVPYFIENIRETNHLLLKIEEIDGPESAANFTLKDIYLREKDITSKSYSEQKSKEGWVGYTIFDKKRRVGQIVDIEIYPQQLMASVVYNNKNILIPLVEELITDVSDENKILTMDLPEGLLDM
jgi:16S rRNA processing protein RimM